MNNRLSVFVVNFPAPPVGVYIEASLDEVIDGPIRTWSSSYLVRKSMKSFLERKQRKRRRKQAKKLEWSLTMRLVSEIT